MFLPGWLREGMLGNGIGDFTLEHSAGKKVLLFLRRLISMMSE